MEHLKALVIKFIMIAVVLGIVLTGFFDVGFGNTLLISLVLTILAYLMGDLGIFRHSGSHSKYAQRNGMATVSDAILAFLVIWLLGAWISGTNHNWIAASLISAIIIAGGEWFFHHYLEDHVFDEKLSHS